ncbi:MAG: N-acyl amino acid synthase FeeM domain-containing protein [Pirellulaceae bacterium]
MSEANLKSCHRDRLRGLRAPIAFKVAETAAERRGAFRLVYDQYVEAGLARPNVHRVRVTPHHLLPTTHVFVGYYRSEIIATMTLVGDGKLGLPMESIFGDEVQCRRVPGSEISQVACVAVRRTDHCEFLTVFCGLGRVLVQFARRQGYARLLAVCHPRHAAFYRRFLGFEVIGHVAAYPQVQHHPAVPMYLDFDHLDRHPPVGYERFFGQRLPDEQLSPSRLGAIETSVLRRMIDRAFDRQPAPAPAS